VSAGASSVIHVDQLRARVKLSRKELRRTAAATLLPIAVYAVLLWWAWWGLRSSPEYRWVWFAGLGVAVVVTLAGLAATVAARRDVRVDVDALEQAERDAEAADAREWATGAIAVLGERDRRR
jgi:hypothetical protein